MTAVCSFRSPVLNRDASEPDSALVLAARGGDRAAFGRLYERYKPAVHGILLAHVRFSEAEDLMQTVFLHAFERLRDLRETAAFGGWLAAMARNIATDYHRRTRNVVDLREAKEFPSGGRRTQSDRDDAAAALVAIRSLPDAYKETLMLRLVEGMTGPEIAARTHLTPESVRVNLCRGMKMLRTILEGKDVQ